MMRHEADQAHLLADYCETLTRDRLATPPARLDPQLAILAMEIAELTAPEPDASTLAAIRARVLLSNEQNPAQVRWLRRAQLATLRLFTSHPVEQRESRPPSTAARLAGGVLGIAIATVAIGALILSLAVLRPQRGQGAAPTSTLPVPAIACGFPPTTVRPTAAPRNPTDVGRTATIGVQLTATASVPSPPTPLTPAPSVDPCVMFPGMNLLSLEQAAGIVRALIDDPTAELFAQYSNYAKAPSIVVERPFAAERSLIATVDHFELEASTGKIISLSIASRESLSIPERSIDEDTAASRAEAFAREHFVGLDRLERRSVQQFEGVYRKTEVVWQLRDEQSGAWLPTSVRVSVSRRTGLVIGYWRDERPYTGPSQPQIGEAEARERALAIARQDPRYTDATVAQATLWVAAPKQLNNENGDFRLVWTITLANVPQAAGQYPTPTWYVDAVTGEVIPSKGIG